MKQVASLLILLGFVVGVFLFFLYLGGISPRFLVVELWRALVQTIRRRAS